MDRKHAGIARRELLGSLTLAGAASVAPAAAQAASAPASAPRGEVTTPKDLVVETTSGPIRGYLKDGIRTFKGVPYAKPPEGALRFRPAEPHDPWKEVRWTLAQGPNCPQHNYRDPDPARTFLRQSILNREEEDCLQLNVWTPELGGSRSRPVMVWFHGGAFLNGSAAASPATEGTNLARRGDVVVVSLNHRLNVFGHLNLSDYGSEYQDSANVGVLDLVQALRWVKDNIGRFGGDANNVTIFGQSGGGAKVATLMVMPAARGLFHKAIVQSSSSRIITEAQSKGLAEQFLKEVGVTRANLKDLQTIPAERLLELATKVSGAPLANGIEWRPAVDGRTVLQQPFAPTGPKPSADIPLLIGGTRHEFSFEETEPYTEATLQAALDKKFGAAKARELRAFFRTKFPNATANQVMSLVNVEPFRANHFACAQRKAELGGAGCYAYVFAWETPNLDGLPLAFHASEVPFVFATTDECSHHTTGSPDAARLSARISDAWLAFARSGDPNHPGLPTWPKFDPAAHPTMIFNTRTEVVNRPYADEAAAIRRAMTA